MTPTYRGRHLPPLQNHVLGDPSVSVHINPFVLVAHQQLHPVGVGEDDDCVRLDAALDLEKRTKHRGAGVWLLLSLQLCSATLSQRTHLFMPSAMNTAQDNVLGNPCNLYPVSFTVIYSMSSHFLRSLEHIKTVDSI